MIPWYRYWFAQGDEAPAPKGDAALWTPQALAESQRAMWLQAMQAAEQWWGYWRMSWPGLQLQASNGVAQSPEATLPAQKAASPRVAAPRRPVAAKRTPRARSGAATKPRRGSARGK